MTATLDRALELLRSGRRVEGESLLAQAVEVAAQAAPPARGGFAGKLAALMGRGRRDAEVPASPAHAEAVYELGHYLTACGDTGRALPALRKAAALAPADPAAQRARITYAMNLAEILEVAGELGEAEAVLRANVEERRAFYGEGSEGLAWGLWPLASVVLASGRADEARRLARQALDILWKAGSVYVASVLPILGAVEVEAGRPPPWAEFTGRLPEDLWVRTMSAALQRLANVHTRSAAVAAQQIVALCAPLSAAEQQLPNAWATLAVEALAADAADVAVAASRASVALQDARGAWQEAIGGIEKLAEALEKAGKADDAAAAWADAEARARRSDEPLLLAHTLRNRGLFLAERGVEGWRPLLEESLAAAEAASKTGRPERRAGAPRFDAAEELVRSRAALGIRLQHQGEAARAGELLSAALAQGPQVLHPADSLLFTLRTHAEALRAGKTCGCGADAKDAQRHAVEQAVTAMIKAAVPEGLLGNVALDENGEWQVRLAREPKGDAELQLLDRALRQAIAQLRERAGAS